MSRLMLTPFVLLTLAAGRGVAQTAEPPPARLIQALIPQLGDDSLAKREDASRRLAAIGGAAWDALRDAARNSADAEVRRRATELLRHIEHTLFSEQRRLGRHLPSGWTWATRIVVSPDGRCVISAGCDGLRSWDLASGKQLLFFGQTKDAYWSLSVAADGKRVIAGGNDRIARIFDVATGKQIQQLVGHTAAVWGAAFSPDGKQAVTGAWDKSLRLWDVDTGKPIAVFDGVKEDVRCLAISSNGRWVAAGHFARADAPATARLWDVATRKEIRAFVGHAREITSIAFSADDRLLLTSSFDKTLRLWDVARGTERKRLRGHTHRVEHACFTPDGTRVVSCGDQDNPTLRLWDARSGAQLYESPTVAGGVLGIAALRDGRHCVTAGKDGMIRLWQWVR